jgi:hypothetical protein
MTDIYINIMSDKINYLCIGVQKAGTTSIINYLNLNPDIFCKEEESHFFDNNHDNDITKYEKSFVSNKKIKGEKTPSYCYLRYAINKIYKYNPDMKLILLLREPISRAYSQYNMELNRRIDYKKIPYIKEFLREKDTKLKDITENKDYYIVRGYYDKIIEYILTIFPKKNLCISISEEIRENPEVEYNKIYAFLGARKIKINQNLNTHIGYYSSKIPKDLELMLYNIYKPHNEALYKLLGRKIDIWEKYYDRLK